MTVSNGLIYYGDDQPGILRQRRGRGFSYVAPDGTRIDDVGERDRIAALAVPPAYDDVWISPIQNGHLQATGRDVRKRKQYRYHADWTAHQAATKFEALADFGTSLPAIRRRILTDLKNDPGDRSYAIAAVLALMDRTAIRIGTPEYAAENGTFGATTLKSRHVSLEGNQIKLKYTAKGGKAVQKILRDRTMNKVFEQMQDLPGGTLMTWIDDSGTVHTVAPDAINATLFDITGDDRLTAKTFRTWAGSSAAMKAALREDSLTIKHMATAASERLANTPTIARNSYIHPDVIALHDASLTDRTRLADQAPDITMLRKPEAVLLHLISS